LANPKASRDHYTNTYPGETLPDIRVVVLLAYLEDTKQYHQE
jgi:hypothetical protein